MGRFDIRRYWTLDRDFEKVMGVCAASLSLCCMIVGFIWVCFVYMYSAISMSPENRGRLNFYCDYEYPSTYLVVSMCTFICLAFCLVASTWIRNDSSLILLCIVRSILKKAICISVALLALVMVSFAIVAAVSTQCDDDISKVNMSYMACYFWILTYIAVIPVSTVVYRYRINA